MLIVFAEVDTKSKAMLMGAGHLIYRCCDDYAQQMIQSAEKSGNIIPKGTADDLSRELLVESIIDVIAKQSTTELVRMEVDLLSDIQKCIRKQGESPHNCANRFAGTVARYVNQTTKLTELSSRQFAVTMLRNAKLTPDTLNGLIFQLTYKIDVNSRLCRFLNLEVTLDTANKLVTFIKENLNNAVECKEIIQGVSDEIEKMKSRSDKECNISIFSIEEATQSLAQVKM